MDGDAYECPTCDYTSDHEGGVKIHHYHAHGESIAKSEYECDVCGAVEERYDCEVTGDVVFCSTECEAEYKRQQPKEEHPRWKGGKITVQCPICGDGTEVKQFRLNESDHIFCSLKCRGKWHSKELVGKDHPQFEGIAVECDWCGETTYKLEGRIERSEQDFCSHECHNKWMAEYQHGPNHHQWTGGRRDYGPGWNEQKRESVRERHNRQCYDCGADESEVIAEYGRKLDVHHLVIPDSDTNPAVHNAKRNLIPLCIPCHHEWEHRQTPQLAAETAAEVSKA